LIVGDFPPIELEIGALINKSRNNQHYSKDIFDAVLKKLISSPHGYIDYSHACDEFGKEIITGLIKAKIVLYRPTSTFARDLIPGPNVPVLTSPGEPHLRAMEIYVKTLSTTSKA
jgi:hypothetical protein